ncbi:MAG: hypothetical protein ACYS5V_08180 [Planctomycetota bacterium]|jgi:hypothetical protein
MPAKRRSGYQTQWASQFFVAAELCRRGYMVALTLGNAPRTDLMATSPSGRCFRVEVKGQATKSFWLIRRHPVDEDHFYVLVFIPKAGPPDFFVLTCEELQALREEYAVRKRSEGAYRDELGGFNWTTPREHRDRWDKLPG